METESSVEKERRHHHQVRQIFPKACELLSPVVAGNDTVKMVSSFAMARMLQSHFPELNSGDISVIITTVEKLHREERLHAILNKKG